MQRYNYRKKELKAIIDEVFNKDKTLLKLDKTEFENLYFDHVIKRLKKPSGIYEFTRDDYQTSIRLYFYYSQEKNIYNILALASVESRLFDGRSN